MNNQNQNKNKLGKIYSVFFIILLGAIGSGVWDLFLKDFVYYLGDLFVKTMSAIYSGYFDRLYEDVGKQSKVLIYLPSLFIIVFIIASPIFVYLKVNTIVQRMQAMPKLNQNNRGVGSFLLNLAKNRRHIFISIYIVPTLYFSISYTDLLIKSLTNISATNNMERWLSIVRPYIEEKDYYLLVSDFRMVHDRKSYQLLVHKLEKRALEHSVLLPEMRLYGIEVANK